MRCIAEFAGGYVNIPADRMEKIEDMIYVYNKDRLVAAFDVSVLLKIHISEKKEC